MPTLVRIEYDPRAGRPVRGWDTLGRRFDYMRVQIEVENAASMPRFVALRREDSGEWWGDDNGGGWTAERQPGVPLQGPDVGAFENLSLYHADVTDVAPGVLVTAYLLRQAEDVVSVGPGIPVLARAEDVPVHAAGRR
jgi:hypothetical protein